MTQHIDEMREAFELPAAVQAVQDTAANHGIILVASEAHDIAQAATLAAEAKIKHLETEVEIQRHEHHKYLALLNRAKVMEEAKYLPVIEKLVSQMIKSAEYLNNISRINPTAGVASDELIAALDLAAPLLKEDK